jgi:AcrR family transcriptional regulator
MRAGITNHHESTHVRQKQIIAAAKKLIIKRGSEHVTLRRIALEIGFSEGAIYRHFVSKKEILSVLLDDVEQSFLADLEDHKQNNHDGLGTLHELLMQQLAEVKGKKGVAFQIIAEIISLGDRELNQKAQHVVQKFIDRIQGILAEGIESGTIRPDIDQQAMAVLLFSMIQGLATIWALSRYSVDLEQKYQYLWQTFQSTITITPLEDSSRIL